MSCTSFITLEEVNFAYLECRKNKRHTKEAVAYEAEYEINNFGLWRDLLNGYYKIGTSVCFCVKWPKLREIFAAKFRDRIVHHIIIRKMMPIFEKEFIENTYSCRKGRGVFFGVSDIENQIKAIGKDCWFVKLDLSGFFMSIDKDILWKKLEALMDNNKEIFDGHLNEWKWLVNLVVFNECEKNCEKRGDLSLWNLLAPNKSLFNTGGKGIPIGNLTSQVFANFYLTEFDKILKGKVQGYGRYVDDFILLDTDLSKLKKLIEEIRKLLGKIGLKLNEKKTIIQRCDKGLAFTGYVIQPFGIYPGHRLSRSILNLRFTKRAQNIDKYIRSANSFLGFTTRTLSFKLRYKFFKHSSNLFKNEILVSREEYKSLIKMSLELLEINNVMFRSPAKFRNTGRRDQYILTWSIEVNNNDIIEVKYLFRGNKSDLIKAFYNSVDDLIKSRFMEFEYRGIRIKMDNMLFNTVLLHMFDTPDKFPLRINVGQENGLDFYLSFDNLLQLNDFRLKLLNKIRDNNNFKDLCKLTINHDLNINSSN